MTATTVSAAPTLDQRLAMRERPAARVVMRQRWEHLLFLHWRFDPDLIQSRLPRGLTVDRFDDSAWLGVVPFFMCDIRICGLPPIPTAANFLELNLRTYVHDQHGTPGVWFFSLDANSRLTVWGARTWFRLPYRHARMSATVTGAPVAVDYQWRRRGAPAATAARFHYRSASPPRAAEPGTLEFFLVERYLLFAQGRGDRLYTGRVWHAPYPVTNAHVADWNDQLLQLNGFPSPGRPPDHAAYSPGVQVDIFGLQ